MKIKRASLLPISVHKAALDVTVKRLAVEKHMAHNKSLRAESAELNTEWILLYPDFDAVLYIPGTKECFSVEKGITTEYRANFLGIFVEPAPWLASRLECLKTEWLSGPLVSSLYVYIVLARWLASRFECQKIEWPGGSTVLLNVERSSGSAAH